MLMAFVGASSGKSVANVANTGGVIISNGGGGAIFQ